MRAPLGVGSWSAIRTAARVIVDAASIACIERTEYVRVAGLEGMLIMWCVVEGSCNKKKGKFFREYELQDRACK